jgi:hypothetical protein
MSFAHLIIPCVIPLGTYNASLGRSFVDDLRSSNSYTFYQFPPISAIALLSLSLRSHVSATSFPHPPNACHSRSTSMGSKDEQSPLHFTLTPSLTLYNTLYLKTLQSSLNVFDIPEYPNEFAKLQQLLVTNFHSFLQLCPFRNNYHLSKKQQRFAKQQI